MKPIRCVVIQLARLGDTLQSLMALRAAKQLYPQLEIHFVARESFAAAAKRVPWITEVITLPTQALIKPLQAGTSTEKEAAEKLAEWAKPLCAQSWDYVVNWTYSESSSFLTALIPGKIKLGFTRRRDMSFIGAEGWSHYIQAIVQGHLDQNIHLTDILTTQLLTALQIHEGDPANDGNSPVTSKAFFQLEVPVEGIETTDPFSGIPVRAFVPGEDLSRKWIAIQLGAAHASKTWPTEKWAGLIATIVKRHSDYRIVLIGGKDDLDREKQVLDHLKGGQIKPGTVVSLVGKTHFDTWASVVSKCQWVFAADTAAIHLASVLGTRVLNISVGPVRLAETGPYGNGHYVISSDLACPACSPAVEEKVRKDVNQHVCRHHVSVESAYATWSYAMNEWAHRRNMPIEQQFAQLGMSHALTQVAVHRSKIRTPDEGGGVHYEPQIKRTLKLAEWNSMVLGHIARAWYCGWVPAVGQEIRRESISPKLVQKLREIDEAAQVLLRVCEEARKTALVLNQKSSKLRSDKVMGIRDREDLRDLGSKLQELENLIERLGKAQPTLLAFSQMHKVLMHSLKGQLLSELGKETADCLKHLNEGVTILREWLKFTLELAKPVAVHSNIESGSNRPKEVTT